MYDGHRGPLVEFNKASLQQDKVKSEATLYAKMRQAQYPPLCPAPDPAPLAPHSAPLVGHLVGVLWACDNLQASGLVAHIAHRCDHRLLLMRDQAHHKLFEQLPTHHTIHVVLSE